MSNPATDTDQGDDFNEDELWAQRLNNLFYAAVIVVAVVVLAYWLPRGVYFIHALEEWTRDFRIAVFTPHERVNQDIAVVTVTEETLEHIGAQYRSPVDRAFLADLIQDLDRKGVKAIGLDIVLDTPSEVKKDEALRDAIREAKSILVMAWAKPAAESATARERILRFFAKEDQAFGYPFVETSEFEGTVRHFRTRHEVGGETRLHFAAKIAEEIGAGVPPADRLRIRWHGQPKGPAQLEAFRTFPAHEVDKTPSDWFANKIVLIGLDLEDVDRHRTPFNTQPEFHPNNAKRMAGVTVHAHILSQLMKGRTDNEANLTFEFIILVFFALTGVAFAILGVPYLSAGIIAAMLSAGWIAITGAAFSFLGYFLPFLGPLIALFLSATLGLVYMANRYRNQRQQIRNALTRYMPPEIVSRLELDPKWAKLGGKRRIVTVLFTDMEGFTALTETLDADLLAKFISEYLEGISRRVLKRGGTIDKYLGDGTMSFFGAPESGDDDADQAVKCALEINNFTEAFRIKWSKRNIPIGRTRIGIHTGYAMVGNYGGKERFDYTALGDTVNTAARLETAGKIIPATALVSEDTKRACQSSWFRPAGKLFMPGKHQGIVAYEPIPMNDAERLEHLDEYLGAYGLLDQGHPSARDAFARLVEADPDDPLAAFHLKRIDAGENQSSITLGIK